MTAKKSNKTNPKDESIKEVKKEAEPSFISKISLFFTTNYRITLLFLLGILVLGSLSYTTFLKREGFPPVSFPLITMNVNYLVDDSEQVNDEVIEEIEPILTKVTEVSEVNTVINDNGANIQIFFEEEVSLDSKLDDIQTQIDRNAQLPEQSEIIYNIFRPASPDGQNDFILNIYNSDQQDVSVVDLRDNAQRVADAFSTVDGIVEVNLKDQFTTQQDQESGDTLQVRSGFNRVGVEQDSELNFYDAYAIGVVKKDDYSAVELSESLTDEIDQITEGDQLDEGYRIAYAYNPADTVKSQIADLESNAIWGLAIVALIMFFIIGWKAALVLIIFIPMVLAMSFSGFFGIGYSLNVITLFALILVIGLLADDAIVVLEAIFYYKSKGLKGVEAVKAAMNDIGLPDVAGTVTTVLVFLPMAFVSGVLGDFIRAMPVTVSMSLVFSLIAGITVVAFLSNILFSSTKASKPQESIAAKVFGFFPSMTEKFTRSFGVFVGSYMKRWYLILIVFLTGLFLIGGSQVFASRLEFNLFPAIDDSDAVIVNINYRDGVSITEAQQIATQVQDQLTADYEDEIEKAGYILANSREAIMLVNLIDMSERDITSKKIAEEFGDTMNNNLDTASVAAYPEGPGGPPSSEFPFAVRVYSSDPQDLENATEAFSEFIQGQTVADIEILDTRVDFLNSIAKSDGERYASVRVKFEEGFNSETFVSLEEKLDNEFNEDRLSELGLTKDDIEYDEGQEGEFRESFDSAIFMFIIALLVMYGFLVALFGSFSQPFLVLMAIPFSFPGVFTGLTLTDNPLSFFVTIGFISLVGIVVNNTIILISYANNMRQNGMSTKDAIAEAVKVRARPIFATTATTLGGLIPLAVTDPFWEPLATTIISGLISSFILVLTVFPIFYLWFENVRDKKTRLLGKVKHRLGIEL